MTGSKPNRQSSHKRELIAPIFVSVVTFAIPMAIHFFTEKWHVSADQKRQFDWSTIALAALVHLVIAITLGFTFESAYQLRRQSKRLLLRERNIARKLERTILPLQIIKRQGRYLKAAPEHTRLLHKLLDKSIHKQHNIISRVRPNEYLEFLRGAIENSSTYFTIQRKPPTWFENNANGKKLLQTLDKSNIESYIRVFVIDESEVQGLETELQDESKMSKYWQWAGDKAQCYWVNLKDLRDEIHLDPEEGFPDVAMCDDMLVLSYVESAEMFEFDVKDPRRHRFLIETKAALERQIEQETDSPFRLIRQHLPPPKPNPQSTPIALVPDKAN